MVRQHTAPKAKTVPKRNDAWLKTAESSDLPFDLSSGRETIDSLTARLSFNQKSDPCRTRVGENVAAL